MDAAKLLLALAQVCESAACACRPWIGSGDLEGVDRAAVDAMRASLADLEIDGRVVAGEGVKDQAPRLAVGERVGRGRGPCLDIAVDPVDGTRAAAAGVPGAITAIAAAPRGQMRDLGEVLYLEKWVTAGSARGAVDPAAPVEVNLRAIAAALGRPVSSLRVAVLDRERNRPFMDGARQCGSQLALLEFADLSATVVASREGAEIDVLCGVGGAPEGLVAAAAVVAQRGAMWARAWSPQAGIVGPAWSEADLVGTGTTYFAVAGVTGSELIGAMQGEGAPSLTLHRP